MNIKRLCLKERRRVLQAPIVHDNDLGERGEYEGSSGKQNPNRIMNALNRKWQEWRRQIK